MAILKSRESLAVKHRPKRLEQLIGQEDIVSLLQGQFRSKSGINRSFLLSGPSGCGKTTLGRIVAHYINCEHFDQDTCLPCGTCDYCKDVARGYYGGVDEINFSDTRGIDTVRAVIESTAYASQYNAHVFICDEIQCLTAIAQNALLKILEEPPEGVVFLLLTTDPQKLLPTIINRCCPLTVSRVDDDVIADYLAKICKLENRDYFTPKEKFANNEEAQAAIEKAYTIFKNIAKFSSGLVRQALATLEAVLSSIEGGQKVDTQDVEVIRKIVGQFVDNPNTEPNLAAYLIQGVYSGKYSAALSNALKLISSTQATTTSCKYLFEKAMDSHLQSLYYLVDPKKKLGNLCDAFYAKWHNSMLEAVKTPGGLQLTHQSAADIVGIFLQLISDLGTYVHDERRLVVAATVKMLDAVNKHRDLAYTRASAFHKMHAPELLKTNVVEEKE
jgi:DNA polymerase III subunit gamma/tau